MSMLSYTNLNAPAPQSLLGREVITSGSHTAFLAEFRAAREMEEQKRRRPTIYRPGQVPKWAEEAEDEEEEEAPSAARALVREKLSRKKLEIKTGGADRRKAEAEVLVGDGAADKPIILKTEEQRVPAPVPVNLQVPEAEDVGDDEDEAASRRARARARAKAKEQAEREAQEAEERARAEQEALRAQQEEESEYETDSEEEEEETQARPMLKPVFVKRDKRITIEEAQRIEEEEAKMEEERKQRELERRKESKALVVEQMRLEELQIAAAAEEAKEQLPDDSDDVEDMIKAAAELEAWKLREIKRLKRDKEEREKWEKEKADILRRRNMTDEEIAAENAANPLPQKPKGEMKYLQKYYHPGAFYQDDEETKELFMRDFTAPVGQDKEVDRLFLPKVLQVKKFGLKGRTKYTHLTDQDTTQHLANPWVNANKMNEELVAQGKLVRQERQLAGSGSIQLPTKRRKVAGGGSSSSSGAG